MRRNFLITLLLSLFIATGAPASTKVIYGEDNRVDVYESHDSLFVELSESTAAMISSYKIEIKEEEAKINASSLESRGICSSERFAKQPTAASCSAFLVAPDILVTAGHCVRSESSCKSNSWVFDYKVEHEDQAKVSVPASSVYSCKKLIKTVLDGSTKDDYAVVQLDREVTDRRILNIRTEGKPSVGDELVGYLEEKKLFNLKVK